LLKWCLLFFSFGWTLGLVLIRSILIGYHDCVFNSLLLLFFFFFITSLSHLQSIRSRVSCIRIACWFVLACLPKEICCFFFFLQSSLLSAEHTQIEEHGWWMACSQSCSFLRRIGVFCLLVLIIIVSNSSIPLLYKWCNHIIR
jgi:hypothetical protein